MPKVTTNLSDMLGVNFSVVKVKLPEGIHLPEGSLNILKAEGHAEESPYRPIAFLRYYNRHVWHSVATVREYSNRKNQRPVFADLLPKEAIT